MGTIAQKLEHLYDSLKGIKTDVENIYHSSDLIKYKTSVPKNSNERLVLDVQGAGLLYYALLGKSKGKNTLYLKFVFDDSFTMYINAGATDSDGNYLDSSALYSVARYVVGTEYTNNNTEYTALLVSPADDKIIDTQTPPYKIPRSVYIMTPRRYDRGINIGGYENGITCKQPNESTTLKNAYMFVSTIEPLMFDSSLKIYAYNKTGRSAELEAYYKLI